MTVLAAPVGPVGPVGPAPEGPGVYAALVHFYDETYQSEPVRMAVLLQPVAGVGGQGMATIQVAETLELRRTLARSLLVQRFFPRGLGHCFAPSQWSQATLDLVTGSAEASAKSLSATTSSKEIK